MFQPLGGVRVLDLTRLLPGPFCSWVLSALGAEVIRLEDPGIGDYTRMWPPMIGRNGAMFHLLNRGKRSLVVDLRRAEGVQVAQRLVAGNDVLLEGFRPGTMARLGLDPDRLRREHPELVICSLSGYGQHGARASRAGHDLNYEALSGMLWLTGSAGGPPVIPGIPVADLAGALHAALAVTGALLQRERGGGGAWIDLSMTEALASMVAPLEALRGFSLDEDRGETMLTGGLASYGVYRTSDGGYLAVAALEPKFWAAVCEAVERPQWKDLVPLPNPRHAEVRDELAAIIAGRSRAEWEAVFAGIDACVEPVLSPSEAARDLHAVERGVVESEGELAWCRTPLGAAVHGSPPAPGQHTDAVLAEAGFASREIAELRSAGVIA
jgi:alpha-methylacyl-CoA racemase